ncbi:MAG: hypothetical protein RRZ85_00690 [Gordonibacter sp.]
MPVLELFVLVTVCLNLASGIIELVLVIKEVLRSRKGEERTK